MNTFVQNTTPFPDAATSPTASLLCGKCFFLYHWALPVCSCCSQHPPHCVMGSQPLSLAVEQNYSKDRSKFGNFHLVWLLLIRGHRLLMETSDSICQTKTQTKTLNKTRNHSRVGTRMRDSYFFFFLTNKQIKTIKTLPSVPPFSIFSHINTTLVEGFQLSFCSQVFSTAWHLLSEGLKK